MLTKFVIFSYYFELSRVKRIRMTKQTAGPIGVFDSGFGGLTVFGEIAKRLPQYDYIYLGDNARVPYGTRSYETVYQYTWECVSRLFEMNCNLVILACNTASAKALRTIQQIHIPALYDLRRVLGVIRPTAEVAGQITKSKKVGIFATQGTVTSNSYVLEIKKFYPDLEVFQEACPMWVPLVENNEYKSPGADYFIQKNVENLLRKCPSIDTVLLACTHYPILIEKIRNFLPSSISIVAQGEIISCSLEDYLKRHPEIDRICTKNYTQKFYTTDSAEFFNTKASEFLQLHIESQHLAL